ncbi:MAG: DUF2398 family protein [Deltaproteobacteria bacterium]|nr:DUF2398 family protein [Deltaproteobacteria bacterium]
MSAYFERMSAERVRKVLNVLVEAPFFYRADEPDLFGFLRKHRAEFQRFFQELYGWQLVVDTHGARLVKDKWHNPALRPSQHDVFDLTRRDDCIAFLLVLEFHEHLLDERNASIDDPEPMRFRFGDLFAFVRSRFQEDLGTQAPDDEGVRRILRALMPSLIRFRFLAEIEPEREERDSVDRENLLYECLPALYLYDVRALGRSALSGAIGGGPSQVAEDAQ